MPTSTNNSFSEADWQKSRVGQLGWKAFVVIAVFGVVLAILLPALLGRESQGVRASTQNMMKQWGIVFKMFANESDGDRYPDLADIPGVWAPDLLQVYPEYLPDPTLLVSREHPESAHLRAVAQTALGQDLLDHDFAAKVMGQSFAYLSHVALSEADVMTLAEERRAGRLDGDEEREVMETGRRTIPLREQIHKCMPTAEDLRKANNASWTWSQSAVPVLVNITHWKNRDPTKAFKGADVLYMDGHVDFVPHGTFPVVPTVMDVLCGLAP